MRRTNYKTLLASNGARHQIIRATLGPLVDAELDGQPSVLADGDDLNTQDRMTKMA